MKTMNTKDYEALQVFIHETNRRFNMMGKTIMDFSGLIKKNRDAIENLTDKIEELQFEDENTKRLVSEVKQDIEEIITDMEIATNGNEGLQELEDVLEVDGEGGIAQAVQQTGGGGDLSIFKKSASAPAMKSAPKPQQSQSANNEPQPQSDNKGKNKPHNFENYKTDDTGFKYPRQKLMDMQWHSLRSLAINTFKCPETKVTREYYVGWVLKKQRDQKIAGGN